MYVLTIVTENCAGSSNLSSQIRRRNKKASLFTDEMTPYTENPKDNKMNSAKLQAVRPTHKNQLYFHIPGTYHTKMKLK